MGENLGMKSGVITGRGGILGALREPPGPIKLSADPGQVFAQKIADLLN